MDKDDPRSGRPTITTHTIQNIELVQKLISNDLYVTYAIIEAETGIIQEIICRSLHESLKFRKVTLHWNRINWLMKIEKIVLMLASKFHHAHRRLVYWLCDVVILFIDLLETNWTEVGLARTSPQGYLFTATDSSLKPCLLFSLKQAVRFLWIVWIKGNASRLHTISKMFWILSFKYLGIKDQSRVLQVWNCIMTMQDLMLLKMWFPTLKLKVWRQLSTHRIAQTWFLVISGYSII